jgi:signal transduction histidine kinase
MDHLQNFHQQLRRYIFLYIVLENISIAAILWCGLTYTNLNIGFVLLSAIIISLGFIIVIVSVITSFVLQPIQALWQAIFHLSPSQHGIASPMIKNLTLGREMVESLTNQLYQLIDLAQKSIHDKNNLNGELKHNFVAQNLPLPLFVLDTNETIKFSNEAAATYLGMLLDDIIGKNVYTVLNMSFSSEDTLDDWLKIVKTKKATDTNSWEKVRLNAHDERPALMFDLASYFNRDNADHNETMLVLFDHTKLYSQDDQAISFVASSVHELRTPLTMLRSYVEVFEEELQPKLEPELQHFMLEMKSTIQQLIAFVNNILNVARVDNDQLELHLQEEDWGIVVRRCIESMTLRAKVHGIKLETRIADNLPAAAVDSLSIGEVINNLVDNAIKYSGSSKLIKIDVHLTSAGLIETTVQDFGVGIESSIISNLFTKFYRDHHNRSQVDGTGLGLYLSKAIITAHGGNVWIRSKVNEGSIFGFTLLPYSKLSQEMKESGNQDLVRSAHGWIKNHSLYRK